MPGSELDEARREIERLKVLAEAQRQSALVQAMRASALEQQSLLQSQQLNTIRRSTSWRLTMPLRLPVIGANLTRRARAVVQKEGTGALVGRVRRRLRNRRLERAQASAQTGSALYGQAVPVAAPTLLAPRVLIIAELSLPQCAKYRVWQKQAHFAHLGIPCTVLPWSNTEACKSALQTHALVIFYRVPGMPDVLAVIAEAKRLNVTSYWEADDLIFDMQHYRANRNLSTLSRALRRSVLSGVDLFRTAMLACDSTIASTPSLAERMQEAGAGPSVVIENALDRETLDLAAGLRGERSDPAGEVLIAYGSGSKAHDIDFATAAPALAQLMTNRPQVRLRLVGDLQLPAALERFVERIERLPATGYAGYLGLLASADISLAPLEASAFNDAKSNIKYLEAAILGLPSVCSPRAAFRPVIRHGEDGFLADSDAEWLDALTGLVDSADLRRRIGQAALANALARYAPAAVAEREVRPLVEGLDQRRRKALRVLVVNVYFAPISYGGATIVAEEIVRRLARRDDTELFVFTSQERVTEHQYMTCRYMWEGVPVIAIKPPGHNVVAEFDNPEIGTAFADVLQAVQPDVVHFHCVQNLGATLLRACQERRVPYLVTLHDAWWLCLRQFMVREDHSYCFQTKIDLNVCRDCAPWALHLPERMQILMQALSGAALVLSPSELHRRLYLANGLDPARLLVNHNGVRMPARARQRRGGPELRFGYVGGVSGLKGFHLIRRAFARVKASNYTLVLVDNTLNRGFSSIDTTGWRLAGRVETVPAYSQSELDAFFEGLDVLLFPSQWKESFGLIVCEALARDVWVVITEGIGAADFVVDGENGTIIPLINDPGPLQRAVEALLADPGRLRGWVNPYKDRLRSYDEQADELLGYLRQAVTGPVAPDVPRLPAPASC